MRIGVASSALYLMKTSHDSYYRLILFCFNFVLYYCNLLMYYIDANY